jgi:adenylate kinase
MILLLLGPPGAGKGTQSKLLAEAYGIPAISTGEMFRDHRARGTEIGKSVSRAMSSGKLVTDDIVNPMVEELLSRPDLANGVILDGYPRTVAQAEFLDGVLHSAGKKIDRVLSYEIDPELVAERISGRRSCPQCGAIYHVTSQPPRRSGFCDKDGAGLIQREDDRPENVKKRMKEYETKTRPLKTFYEDRGLLAHIDTAGTPEGIFEATRVVLDGPKPAKK